MTNVPRESSASTVPAYVLGLCLLALAAAAWFAASIELGFSADGAYVFARILEDRTFLNGAWSRLYADIALQWPLVLAVKAGVESRAVLVGLFHLGLFLPLFVSLAICWYASRSLDDDALLLFPLASVLLVSLPAASILAGESQVLAAVVWPILFLLLRPRLSRGDWILLIALLLVLTRLYETAAVPGVIFLYLLGVRWGRDPPAARPMLVAAALLVGVTIAIAGYGTLFPASQDNRAGFLSRIFRYLTEHPMLAASAGALGLLGLAKAGLRILAAPAILLALGSIALTALGRTASADASFNLRQLTLTMLPPLMLAAVWWHSRRPRLAPHEWKAAATVVVFLTAGYAASWTAWRDFRQDFVTTLQTRSGYVPVDSTPIAHNPQRWPWTASLLSILWAQECVKTIIVNRPSPRWEPFDPRKHLPLQAQVAYDVPFATASPTSKRCK